jgi:hypothetical protein
MPAATTPPSTAESIVVRFTRAMINLAWRSVSLRAFAVARRAVVAAGCQ